MATASVKIYSPNGTTITYKAAIQDRITRIIHSCWQDNYPAGGEVLKVFTNWTHSHPSEGDHRSDNFLVEIRIMGMSFTYGARQQLGQDVFGELVSGGLLPPTVGKKRLMVYVPDCSQDAAVTAD